MSLRLVLVALLASASPALAASERTRCGTVEAQDVERVRSKVHRSVLHALLGRMRQDAVDGPQAYTDRMGYAQFLSELGQSSRKQHTIHNLLVKSGRPSPNAQMELGFFYAIVMGCADQILMSRDKFAETPMVESLFFAEDGKEIADAPSSYGIKPFAIASEPDTAFVRLAIKQIEAVEVPARWLRGDLRLLLLREMIRANRRNEASSAVDQLQDIYAKHPSDDQDTLDNLLLRLQSALR